MKVWMRRALGRAHRFAGAANVLAAGTGEAGDDRAAHGFRDAADGVVIALAAIGKPASSTSTPSSARVSAMRSFFVDVHGEAGRLFAVAQGGVEDDDAVGADDAEIRVVDHGGLAVAGGFAGGV